MAVQLLHRAEQVLLPRLHGTEQSCSWGLLAFKSAVWCQRWCTTFCSSCWPFSFPTSGNLVVFPGRLIGVGGGGVWALLCPSRTGLVCPCWEDLRCSCLFPRIFLCLKNLLNCLNAAYLMHSRSAPYFVLLNILANSRYFWGLFFFTCLCFCWAPLLRDTKGNWCLQVFTAGTEKPEPFMTLQSCIFVWCVLGMVLKCPQWSEEN